MPWTRLDDGFCSNPKIWGLSDEAFRLYVVSLNWSVGQLTDGHVVTQIVGMGLPHSSQRARKAAASELLAVGLWEDNGNGWLIHDFHEYQETKDVVRERRDRWADRKAVSRDEHLKQAVRSRDHDHCRYCDVEVDWNDRTGTTSGTFDHVFPGSGSDEDNLVVCCRRCNNKKGRRSPQDADMMLLPVRGDKAVTKAVTSQGLTEPLSRGRGHPSPIPKEAKASTQRTDEAQTNREGVWTALEDLFGEAAETERKLRGKVVRSIIGAGGTFTEVKKRAAAWPKLFPRGTGPPLTLTATALEKWWGQLGMIVETGQPPPDCAICGNRRLVGVTSEGEVVSVELEHVQVRQCSCVGAK